MSREKEITLARLERMLLTYAALVDLYGPAAQPWLDRLEQEYMAAKERGRTVDRVRRMIENTAGI